MLNSELPLSKIDGLFKKEKVILMGGFKIKTLIFDLDGTLLPKRQVNDLYLGGLHLLKSAIAMNDYQVGFATGRGVKSVLEILEEIPLPLPKFIVTECGSSLYVEEGGSYNLIQEYSYDSVLSIRTEILKKLSSLKLSLQEERYQTQSKVSFYTDKGDLKTFLDVKELLKNMEVEALYSSANNKDYDYLDVLHLNNTKLSGIKCAVNLLNFSLDNCIYFGDSGNDVPVFLGGIRSVVLKSGCLGLEQALFNECDRVPSNIRVVERMNFAEYVYGVLKGLEIMEREII